MRRHLLLLSTIILFFFCAGRAAPTGNPHCIYLSPLPGAAHVSTASGLIMRFGVPVDPASLTAARLQVVGSASGTHDGSLSLSDDGETVLFAPAQGFTGGEKVQVSLAGGIAARKGGDLGSLRWSFVTSLRAPAGTHGSFLAALAAEISAAPSGNAAGPKAARSRTTSAQVSGDLPGDFPAIAVDVDDAPISGGIYLSNFAIDPGVPNTPYLMVLDGTGDPLFYRKAPNICFDFKPQANGLYTYFQDGEGRYVGLDSTMQPVTSYRAGNGYPTDGHDLLLLPDGHALLMASDTEIVDMSKLIPGGDPAAIVSGLIVQELDRAGNVVFEWRSWDHFKITDATLVDLSASLIDAVHGNALELDGDGNILLSSRHLDEITKINRRTGDIVWRLGGKNNQFKLLGDTLWFSHQHAIRRIANGHYTLFDNGNGHTPPFSRAAEYEIDTAAMTCRLVWQFVRPNTYAFALGYVQRLANGNTVIGWGATNPSMSVVTPGGETINELSLPDGVFSYRAYDLPWTSLVSAVNTPATTAPGSFALGQNYPNPFNPSTTIRFHVPLRSVVTLTVYNALGQKVLDLLRGEMEPGEHSVRFDGTNLPSGVYFYRMTAGAFKEIRRMILVK
ncbi:MAG TPA: aryl-sulfate sulfotransferase [Bacteroidota bacterium]